MKDFSSVLALLPQVIPFTLKAIQSISKCRMTIPPGVSVESEDMKKSLYFQLKKVEEKFRVRRFHSLCLL